MTMGSHMRRMKGRLMARRGARTWRLPAALALLLAAALLTSFLPASPPPVAAARVPGGGAPPPGSGAKTSTPQVRVIDGMTIDTYIDGEEVGIHLVGITAPQGNTACGKLATKALQALVKGGGLALEEDGQIAFTAKGDKKGTKLRAYYARTKDGRSVTQELVKAGVVAVDDGEGEARHRHKGDEDQAKAGRVGCLWANGASGLAAQASSGGGHAVADQQAVGSDTFRAAPQAPAPQASLAATTLPANFSQQTVVAGLNTPTGFIWLPDGRMLVTEKPGKVRVVKNGALLPTPLIDLTGKVNDYWDHGLLGMAADPNFATNGYLYLLYTYEDNAANYNGPKTGRLARYTVAGDTAAAASEQVILGTMVGAGCDIFPMGTDCMPSENPSHSVGSVRFAPDGTLWTTEGDGASFNVVDTDALRSQNLDSLSGKLLHITTSGQGISTNPFWDANAAHNRSKVWAYGFRNPFRWNFRAGTATPYIGDVGWSTWEEINVAGAGKNYGWPCYEGEAQQAGYAPTTDPLQGNAPVCQNLYNKGIAAVQFGLATWGHVDNGVTVGSAAVGGAFYTGTSYPAQYQGAYFYADYGRSDIRTVTVDANNVATGSPQIFATGADGPTDLAMGADGNLYYAAINVGEIRKIAVGVAPSPLPAPWADRDIGNAGTTGSASYASGTYTVAGSGDDIYNTADSFHYAYQPLTGDGQIVAHVASLANTDPWAKAGVMIRETLTGGAANAMMAVTPGNGTNFQWRAAAGGTSNTTAGPVATAPYWVRLVRSGATFTGSVSSDGATWTTVGTATIAMASAVYIGLPVTAHNVTALNTATFDHVSLGPVAAGGPTATISSPAAALTYKVGDTISYAGSATDPKDGAIPASGLSWSVLIHHCTAPTICHTHYLLQNRPGASGSFAVPDHGFDPTYLELQLTATNSAGLTNTASVSIQPITVAVTVATAPTGLQVVVGGTAYTAPTTLRVVPGSSGTIQVASPQGNQAFASWSDGGAQQHNIVAPTTDTTYTATFTSTAPTCAAGQYLAQYFANTTLAGTPVTARCEAAPINDTLGTTPNWPPTGVPQTNFSARWDGQFSFATAGAYTFTATADDGIRVYLDNALVIDHFVDQGPTTYTYTAPSLTAGTHAVKVEYYQGGGGATAQVSWQASAPPPPPPTTCAVGQYLAQYFANTTLAGTPVTARCEAAPINDTLGTTPNWPPTGVPQTNFSARWDGQFSFATAGAYTFTATADDGIRVYLDNALVIDHFVDQGPTTYTYTAPSLTAGTHAVKVEYYQGCCGATVQVKWS